MHVSITSHTSSHLDVVLCDLNLSSVDVVNQFSQGLTVHLSDLHLMGFALTHITCTVKHTLISKNNTDTSGISNQANMCTCEHGTEIGTTRRQDHPVSWHLNAPCYQLDVTQHFFTA